MAALSVAAMHLWLDLNNQALIAADSVFNTGTQFIAKSYLFVDFSCCWQGFVLFISYAGEFSTRISLRDWKTFLVRRVGRLFPLHLFMLALFLPYELSRLYLSTGSSAFAPPNTVENLVLSIFLMQAWVPHGSLEFTGLVDQRRVVREHLFPGAGLHCAASEAGPSPPPPPSSCWRESASGACSSPRTSSSGTTRTIRCCDARWNSPSAFASDASAGADLVRAAPAIPVIGSQLFIAAILAAAILAMDLGLNDTYPVVAFSLLIYAIAVRRKDTAFLSPRPLRLLGEWSYSIYLVHRLICVVTSFVVSRLMHGRMLTDLEAAAMFVAVLAVVIGVSALTYRWIEVPARRAVYGMTIRNARTA